MLVVEVINKTNLENEKDTIVYLHLFIGLHFSYSGLYPKISKAYTCQIALCLLGCRKDPDGKYAGIFQLTKCCLFPITDREEQKPKGKMLFCILTICRQVKKFPGSGKDTRSYQLM